MKLTNFFLVSLTLIGLQASNAINLSKVSWRPIAYFKNDLTYLHTYNNAALLKLQYLRIFYAWCYSTIPFLISITLLRKDIVTRNWLQNNRFFSPDWCFYSIWLIPPTMIIEIIDCSDYCFYIENLKREKKR